MKNKRKPVSKRMRFEVLKRDRFTCQYCSAKPPKVPLEVDHIMPVSKGGENVMNNLITACFDCNRGKSNIELTAVPESMVQKMELRSIALEQQKQFSRLLKREKKEMESMIDIVESIYSISVDDKYCFTDKFRLSVKNFIKELGVDEVSEAMEKTVIKHLRHGDVLRYFCGICWNIIKEK